MFVLETSFGAEMVSFLSFLVLWSNLYLKGFWKNVYLIYHQTLATLSAP